MVRQAYYDRTENGFKYLELNLPRSFTELISVEGSGIEYGRDYSGEMRPLSGTIDKIVHYLPAPEGALHHDRGDKMTITLDNVPVELLNAINPDWYIWDKSEEGQAKLKGLFEAIGYGAEVTYDPYNQIIGSENSEMLFGTAERDDIQGGEGDDIIFGGDHDDTIGGGKGADVIYAGGGDDDIYIKMDDAGQGGDTINGEDGDDVITVDMRVLTEKGDAILTGEDSSVINGGNGNDRISVEGGTSVTNGGAGDDDLEFGRGDHSVWGGAGADEYRFAQWYSGSSTVRVNDFDVTEDTIRQMSFRDFQSGAEQVGNDVVWTRADGDTTVIFADQTLADFSSDLFL